jgi:hypothetical protein
MPLFHNVCDDALSVLFKERVMSSSKYVSRGRVWNPSGRQAGGGDVDARVVLWTLVLLLSLLSVLVVVLLPAA